MTEPARVDPAGGGVDPSAWLDRLVRTEGRAVLATLVRTTGRLDLAEDAVQEAVLRALETWPRDGVPTSPRAWLTTVARNRAVDAIRREAQRDQKEEEAVRLLDDVGGDEPDDGAAGSQVHHDLLRLVFTCCHPTLSLDAQVALSLRTLCGLSTAEVAASLLVPEATMTKRLTRARQKIAIAKIPYRVPADHELPDRVAGVAATTYLVFTAGYSQPPPSSEGSPPRNRNRDLAVEGVELARFLYGLMPDDASVIGLLALVLLQHARRAGRFDAAGTAVTLADQDRSRWDRHLIEEGVVLVGEGLRRTPGAANPYVVQAAIAACHALAPTAEDTDWDAIVSWFDVLLAVHDTPVVRLNRAVAIAERSGAEQGLAEVNAIDGLDAYPFWHASRGELLARLARWDDASAAWLRALELDLPPAHAAFVRARLAAGPTSSP